MQFEINRSHIILVGLVVVLVGAMVGEYYWMQGQITTANAKADEFRLQADLAKGKGETKVVSEADLKKLLGEFSKEIQSAVAKSGEEVKQVINIKATGKSSGSGTLQPTNQSNQSSPVIPSSTSVVGSSGVTSLGTFQFKDYRLTADIDVPNRGFKYTLEQRFQLRVVQTDDGSGLFSTFAEIFELNDKGEQVSKWKLDSFESIVAKPKDSQFWIWAPKVEIGAAVGPDFLGKGRAMFELAFTPMAYGRTRNDNIFRFIRVGVGYDGKYPVATLSPAGYNLGEALPLITDLWIWPSYGFSDVQMILLSISKTL